MSCQRVIGSSPDTGMEWIGPEQAAVLSENEKKAYKSAHQIICHLAVKMPRAHKTGHPGGSLSAFTVCYCIFKKRNPAVDQPLRMSPGHLSVLGFSLQWLFGREGNDKRLASPQALIDNFRTPSGLPGHIEAGIGDIPFGTGPLGKGVSNALGAAYGLKHQKKPGIVDVLLADGDAQEGQVTEAFRLAAQLKTDNLIVHGDFNDIQLSGLPTKTMSADFARIAAASGWQVIEVQNGNDPAQVTAALNRADALAGKGKPVFICYYTTMGYGIDFMEKASNEGAKNYHGAPLNDEEAQKALSTLPDLGQLIKEYEPFRKSEKEQYEKQKAVETDILLSWKTDQLERKGYKRALTEKKGAARKDFGAVHLKNLMAADERIVVLHADLAGSGGFEAIEKEYPDRIVNVGVAEANMYMMAAGMRQTGLLPVTYTFAAFGTNEARANARLIDINCGHTRCGILNDCTHAGLSVGEDGETHQERHYLDIPFDHTRVWMPADCNQAAAAAEKAMELIAEGHHSVYTFFPRSDHNQLKKEDGTIFYGADYEFDGLADVIRGRGDMSDQITIIGAGIPLHNAVIAADNLKSAAKPVQVRVLNSACVRPIDSAAIVKAALETGHLVVVEDHSSETGLASQVADIVAAFSLPCTLRCLGVNSYFPSGTAENLLIMAGLDNENIQDTILDEIKEEVRGGEDALISSLFRLATAFQTRFSDSVKPFKNLVLNDEEYLKRLRGAWKKRACKKELLPANDQILRKLSGENTEGLFLQ